MQIARYLLRTLDMVSPPGKIFAHCDVPCGIYEPDSMKYAADTVLKMTEKMLQLTAPGEPNFEERKKIIHDVARMTEIKEKYAQICKEQLLILWTDYFKEEHLREFPELHATFWKAAKLCSSAKRSSDPGVAKELRDACEKIAQMFLKTKQVK